MRIFRSVYKVDVESEGKQCSLWNAGKKFDTPEAYESETV